jgi:hypothetical protein
MSLTLKQAAEWYGCDPTTWRRMVKRDPTLPRSKKGKEYRFILSDLENWLRADYPEAARKLLQGDACLSDEESGGLASEGLDNRLKRLAEKRRNGLNTSSTQRRGTGNTGSLTQHGSKLVITG